MNATPELSYEGVAVSALSYEQARDALITVVAQLESGDVPLEQALSLWELGEALGARCQEVLDGAEARLSAAVAADSVSTEDDADEVD